MEGVFFAPKPYRYSLLLLANEMLASALGILAGIAALVVFKPLLIKLNLIDQRRDYPSNQPV